MKTAQSLKNKKMNTNKNIESSHAAPTQGVSMNSLRKTSLIAGILYLLTFVSIPTLTLYSSIHKPGFIMSAASDNEVIIGGILEIVVGICSIATAIALYPVLKKQSESLALGLVASRVLEAGTIFTGVAFLLSVVTLHQQKVGENALATSQALVALYDRIFLLGQGFIPAINDILLGLLLYKSGLVPRTLAMIGIIGAFPLVAGYIAVMFGCIERISPLAGLSAVPVAIFEFSLGIYLVVKGFKVAAVTNK